MNLVIETTHTDGILFDEANITTTMTDKGISLIGMYLHGFEKLILPDINKRSSLAERWEQAEA